MKTFLNAGSEPPHYFWRDSKGHEIDLVLDRGTLLDPFEVKSGATFDSSFVEGLRYFASLQNELRGEVIYGGATSFTFAGFTVTSWKEV